MVQSEATSPRAAAHAQHQVQRRIRLDVVVRQRAAVLELLAREDEALLVRWDALLVLIFSAPQIGSWGKQISRGQTPRAVS